MGKIISLEMPEELKEAVRVEAFKRNVSLSACIRQILAEYLKVQQPEKTDGKGK